MLTQQGRIPVVPETSDHSKTMYFQTLNPHESPAEAAAWTAAALHTSQADPFCCLPSWQLAFHDAFIPNRRLFIAEEGGAVLAFAEQFVPPDHIYLTPLESSWFFGCPLMGKGAVALFAKALSFWAEAYQTSFPTILISGIQPGGSLGRNLFTAFNGDFTFYLHSDGVQCSASLTGGVDGYLSRRSANHRSKLKKAAKKAHAAGIAFERHIPASVEEARMVYARMIAVEKTSWKGLGHCGMAEPVISDFYAFLLERQVPFQSSRIIFALHEGKDIGFIFGGMAGDIYRGQQFSYTHDWRAYSIGNLMQTEQILWLCEEKARRYDMGPIADPRMEYKSHWTEIEIPIHTWVLQKK